MPDDQKIVVEVPRDRTLPQTINKFPKLNQAEKFKKAWLNRLVLADNPTDLAFDIASTIIIPALIINCWVAFPLPQFLRIAAIVCGGVCCLVTWQLFEVQEIRNYLVFRLILIGMGVILGL